MAGKRRRFGKLRKLPSGRWQASYLGPDGRYHPAPDTFATKTDGDRWLAAKEIELRQEEWTDPSAGQVPFEDYGRRWLDERRLKRRTRETYRSLFTIYLAPDLGREPVGALTRARIRRWHADQLDKHKMPPLQVAKAYRLLHAILTTAVEDDGILRRNPCRIKGAGKERADERPVFTIEEVFRIADAMGAVEPRFRLMVLLAAFLAMRLGELAGLRRGALDLGKGELRVRRSYDDDPKSTAGYRAVAIPGFLLAEIHAHLRAYVGPGADALVFLGPHGGRVHSGNFNRTWKNTLNLAGFPSVSPAAPHFHDLRHTGSTLAAQSGANVKELMRRLGHASPRAALIYLHATDGRDKEIAGRLDDLVRGRTPGAAAAPDRRQLRRARLTHRRPPPAR